MTALTDAEVGEIVAGADNLVWDLATMVRERNVAREQLREARAELSRRDDRMTGMRELIDRQEASIVEMRDELDERLGRIKTLENRIREAAAHASGDKPGAEPPGCPTPGACSCPAPVAITASDFDNTTFTKWLDAWDSFDGGNIESTIAAFNEVGMMIVRKP